MQNFEYLPKYNIKLDFEILNENIAAYSIMANYDCF